MHLGLTEALKWLAEHLPPAYLPREILLQLLLSCLFVLLIIHSREIKFDEPANYYNN